MNAPVPLPVADLVDRLRLGLQRGGALLTDDERATIDVVLDLQGSAALLHARLVARRPSAFRLPGLTAAGVDDVDGAIDALVSLGLATRDVDWATRLVQADATVLADGCRRLGLPVGGRKEALRARLQGRVEWDHADWVALPHRHLVVRLERWATLQVQPDRAGAVLERLGRLRWVDYAPTGGAVVPTRGDWLAFEALVDRGDALTVDEALAALDWPAWPPGGLDLRRDLAWRVAEHARGLERAGEHAAAEALYAALLARRPSGTIEVRRARVRELGGDAPGALDLLQAASAGADDVDRLAVARAGRRIARALGRAWPPDPPLRRPETRSLALARADVAGSRPLYAVGDDALTIEAAVVAHLAAAGRVAVHGEGGLWRTILGLLLGCATFLPVDGQLPAPRLPGPLDAGSSRFAARRAGAVWALVDDVCAGAASARLRAGHAWIDGRVVTGVDPGLDVDVLAALADALDPAGLLAILRPLLATGARAAAGLPDLVILPGPPTRVEGLHPSRLADRVVLVEVKGEHDTERDAQRVWFDRLLTAGVDVELWRIG